MFAMRYDSAMEWDRQGLRRWVPAGLIWLGIALLDALGIVTSMREQGRHHQWTTLFFTVMFTWLPWAVATPLIVRMGRRYQPLRLRTASGWVGNAALIAGMTVVRGGAVRAAFSDESGEQRSGGAAALYLCAHHQHGPRFACAAGTAADRNGAAQRATLEGAARSAPETDRAALSFQHVERHCRAGARESQRRRGEHDCRTERLAAAHAGTVGCAAGPAGRGNAVPGKVSRDPEDTFC